MVRASRGSGRGSRSRRIWLIDRQAKVISLDLRDDLGHWIAQRLRHGVESREASSLEELARVGIPKEELRDEWKQQCVAQTSIRAHAPAHLKKELDVVLSLQADLDTVNKAIETTRTVLENASDFGNISLEFVRLLLMARDLKINIRKRAVGSFFEWDRLDQAVGGRHNPLGTKIHQQTRKAIAKRTPALKTAIRKFNRYCESLKELKQPEWTITVPLPLPTDLDALRDDASLLADVWIDPSQAQAPRWLEDVDVRKGIRALLLGDRCLEERRRLGREADNICRWYGSELAAAKLALATSSNADITFLLQQRVCELLLLPAKWKNPLVSPQRFDAQTTLASETVNSALGDPQVYAWPFVIETPLPYIIHQDDTDPYGRLEEEEPSYLEAEQHLVEDVFLDDASGDEGPPEDARSEASVMTITMTWETPIHVSIDDAPHFLQATAPVLSQSLQSNVHLDASDMSRLQNRSAWMNDSCINACMQLLQLVFLGPGVRADAGDATLWRNAASTRFWEKDVWTILIHYEDHWMLATIDIPRSRVAYFDSFAREHPWEGHIQDVMQLTARLLNIAVDKGHRIVHAQRAWAVYPTTLRELPQVAKYLLGRELRPGRRHNLCAIVIVHTLRGSLLPLGVSNLPMLPRIGEVLLYQPSQFVQPPFVPQAYTTIPAFQNAAGVQMYPGDVQARWRAKRAKLEALRAQKQPVYDLQLDQWTLIRAGIGCSTRYRSPRSIIASTEERSMYGRLMPVQIPVTNLGHTKSRPKNHQWSSADRSGHPRADQIEPEGPPETIVLNGMPQDRLALGPPAAPPPKASLTRSRVIEVVIRKSRTSQPTTASKPIDVDDSEDDNAPVKPRADKRKAINVEDSEDSEDEDAYQPSEGTPTPVKPRGAKQKALRNGSDTEDEPEDGTKKEPSKGKGPSKGKAPARSTKRSKASAGGSDVEQQSTPRMPEKPRAQTVKRPAPRPVHAGAQTRGGAMDTTTNEQCDASTEAPAQRQRPARHLHEDESSPEHAPPKRRHRPATTEGAPTEGPHDQEHHQKAPAQHDKDAPAELHRPQEGRSKRAHAPVPSSGTAALPPSLLHQRLAVYDDEDGNSTSTAGASGMLGHWMFSPPAPFAHAHDAPPGYAPPGYAPRPRPTLPHAPRYAPLIRPT
ncbi:predicted protein [Postia placenta Mad-698-R]|nr:predicted protein [Postia placenta Mad-698-R]